MSGGSYNYLCHAHAGEIFNHESDIESMADRLKPICPEAAAKTRAIMAKRAEVQAMIDEMTDLWRAVEWTDSCDCSESDLVEAIEKWKAKVKP